MWIRLDMDEDVMRPLIQRHLHEGISVNRQIVEAINFTAVCDLAIEKGESIARGVVSSGTHFNKWIVIKGPKDSRSA